MFQRLREHNVAANPRKTKLGLTQVEYVGHLISAEGTSFTDEKRLKVLQLGVIEESRAIEWSQVHLVPKPNPNEWRFTLDFVPVLEEWRAGPFPIY